MEVRVEQEPQNKVDRKEVQGDLPTENNRLLMEQYSAKVEECKKLEEELAEYKRKGITVKKYEEFIEFNDKLKELAKELEQENEKLEAENKVQENQIKELQETIETLKTEKEETQ